MAKIDWLLIYGFLVRMIMTVLLQEIFDELLLKIYEVSMCTSLSLLDIIRPADK
jgi:hypothetical protein